MKSIWAKYSKVLCALRSEEMHEKVFDHIFFPTLKRFSTPTSTEREGTLPLPSPKKNAEKNKMLARAPTPHFGSISTNATWPKRYENL